MSFPIAYSLFVKVAGKYEVPTDPAHKQIEDKIKAADPNPTSNSASSASIDEHVNGVAWPLPIDNHLIQLDKYVQSRWDPIEKIWITPPVGASNIYAVYKVGSQPEDAELFLQASVEGSQNSDGSAEANG